MSVMRKKRGLPAVAMASALLMMVLPGIPADAGASGILTVYAVNYPLKYFAERVAGEHAEVVFPAPEDVDPAYWMPGAEIVAACQQADVILLNGAGYAKWVKKVSLPRSKMVNTTGGSRDQYITSEEMTTHSHGPEGDHAHESLAFTTWLDFEMAARQAEAIAGALARRRPPLRDALHENLSALVRDLNALDEEMKEVTAGKSSLPLVMSHPVYDYLARRYVMNARSVHWEPGEEPTLAQWSELKAILKEHPAQWMVWEGEPLPGVAAELEKIGVKSLVFDPAGNVPAKGDFLSVMKQNIANLKTAYNGVSP
jgi:zinc transport system substrate-binding protein